MTDNEVGLVLRRRVCDGESEFWFVVVVPRVTGYGLLILIMRSRHAGGHAAGKCNEEYETGKAHCYKIKNDRVSKYI